MLAVGFVTWGFVAAGALAMAIPIIIHILNRRRFKTVTWAAMEFLLRAMRKNRRRLRFEQWVLLATRCALVLLLGMALALFVRAQGWSFGSVYFAAWWMLGGLAVVLAMTWRLERAGVIRK
jgi:hypothetical protein